MWDRFQAEAPRRFFRDPASLCEKILLSSSADVDIDLLVSFSAFVSSPAGRPLVAGWLNLILLIPFESASA